MFPLECQPKVFLLNPPQLKNKIQYNNNNNNKEEKKKKGNYQEHVFQFDSTLAHFFPFPLLLSLPDPQPNLRTLTRILINTFLP